MKVWGNPRFTWFSCCCQQDQVAILQTVNACQVLLHKLDSSQVGHGWVCFLSPSRLVKVQLVDWCQEGSYLLPSYASWRFEWWKIKCCSDMLWWDPPSKKFRRKCRKSWWKKNTNGYERFCFVWANQPLSKTSCRVDTAWKGWSGAKDRRAVAETAKRTVATGVGFLCFQLVQSKRRHDKDGSLPD